MASFGVYGDVRVDLGTDFVARVEIARPPDNFFDRALIASIVLAFFFWLGLQLSLLQLMVP